MRPVDKGETPRKYTKYQDARNDLFNRIGIYCSYCEMTIKNMAEVEHIVPINKGGQELEWENFLLSCKYCNTCKSDKNDSRDNYLWPDTHNIFELFKYDKINQVTVNKQLSDEEKIMAQNMIELLNLDRHPGKKGWNKSVRDTRYMSRYESWRKAEELLLDYELQPINALAKCIASNASSSGHFSIWMEVFDDYEEVKKLIVEAFKGTDKTYFSDVEAYV